MKQNKLYIGDGIFLQAGRYPGEFILTTEDGIRTTNTIYLGEEEAVKLISALTIYLQIRNTLDNHVQGK